MGYAALQIADVALRGVDSLLLLTTTSLDSYGSVSTLLTARVPYMISSLSTSNILVHQMNSYTQPREVSAYDHPPNGDGLAM
jgi:hypothetical protein